MANTRLSLFEKIPLLSMLGKKSQTKPHTPLVDMGNAGLIPAEIVEQIATCLTVYEAIQLASVSRGFYRVVMNSNYTFPQTQTLQDADLISQSSNSYSPQTSYKINLITSVLSYENDKELKKLAFMVKDKAERKERDEPVEEVDPIVIAVCRGPAVCVQACGGPEECGRFSACTTSSGIVGCGMINPCCTWGNTSPCSCSDAPYSIAQMNDPGCCCAPQSCDITQMNGVSMWSTHGCFNGTGLPFLICATGPCLSIVLCSATSMLTYAMCSLTRFVFSDEPEDPNFIITPLTNSELIATENQLQTEISKKMTKFNFFASQLRAAEGTCDPNFKAHFEKTTFSRRC